ncbi:MATE family efflux transporter [Anaerostipes sp.]|uniref:MATE family efflux transporter n=1 Tax=Anaerostipes sp. TaxID=1872530 RepID=UPI0025BE7B64|nr:MATE family efflux transporter [Anaerostipes sp.]MBS7008496.1 MATE family efflux transporter [Anaerostipes sp.]
MQIDLTDGRIGRSIAVFSLPMILGNLLQQLYNIADTLIVGRTIGAAALSAVGSAYALMVLLTSVLLGLCMGSGVVFAQLYGRREMGRMKTAIVNAFVFVCLVSAVITAAAFLLLDRMIVWLHIPKEAASYTHDYLFIIFFGIFFVCIYNFFCSVLRSIGNTLTPLIYLAVSAVLNIILDIVFILKFEMGIAGAAWATVAAQGVSAVLITIYFFRKAGELCPKRCHMRYSRELLRMIISNSSLTAIQQSVMNLGILMVQGLVNSFGFAVSAAFAAVVKIDAFAYMPAQDFGNAFTTFIAQNYGAGKPERIKKGMCMAAGISACFCALASVFVVSLAKPLMRIFIDPGETKVLGIGVQYLHIVGCFYAGIGILFLFYGLYRGLGRSQISILLTVISLGSRVLLAYILSAVPGVGLLGIWWAVPAGWIFADFVGFLYFICKKSSCCEESKI